MFQKTFDVQYLDGVNGFAALLPSFETRNALKIQNLGDVNGDGISDVAAGMYSKGFNEEGYVFVVYGHSGPFQQPFFFDNINGTNGFRVTGSNSLGQVVFNVGDFNGDGINDVGTCDSSNVYVIFGSKNLTPEFNVSSLNGLNGFTIINTQNIPYVTDTRLHISGVGDFNGDGYDDIAIANTFMPQDLDNLCGVSACNGGTDDMVASQIFVVYGQKNISAKIDASSLNGQNGIIITGAEKGDFAGMSISGAGDFNGDGYSDLVVGAPCSSLASAQCAGITYVVYGNHYHQNFTLESIQYNSSYGFYSSCSTGSGLSYPGDQCGTDVGSVGASSNISFSSILVSSRYGTGNSGYSYLLNGGADNFANGLQLSQLSCSYPSKIGGYVIQSSISGNTLNLISGVGDVNADGYNDFIIGLPNDNNADGRAFLLYGNHCGSVDIGNICDGCGFEITGIYDSANDDDSHGKYALSVASAGDINDDGIGDFMVGISTNLAGEGGGIVYVVFGEL